MYFIYIYFFLISSYILHYIFIVYHKLYRVFYVTPDFIYNWVA